MERVSIFSNSSRNLKKKKKLEICNVSAYSQIIREIKKFNLRNQFLIVTNLFEIFFENITMGAVTIYDKKKRKKTKYNQRITLFIRNQLINVYQNQLSSIIYIIDPIAYFRQLLIIKNKTFLYGSFLITCQLIM